MDNRLEDEYEFELASGFSSLERVGDHKYRVDPNMSYDDDPYGDIYADAVYGGSVTPEGNQHFYVYDINWPESVDQPGAEEFEMLGDEMNAVFEGWIITEEGERVFALSKEHESSAHDQFRRQREDGNQ